MFTGGTEWEESSPVLSEVASIIAGKQSSVALLINGGSVACLDALCKIMAGRPVIALEGSGRTADFLAKALKERSKAHSAVREMMSAGLLHMAQLGDGVQVMTLIRHLLT